MVPVSFGISDVQTKVHVFYDLCNKWKILALALGLAHSVKCHVIKDIMLIFSEICHIRIAIAFSISLFLVLFFEMYTWELLSL